MEYCESGLSTKHRTNAGYEIFDSVIVSGSEFVVGESTTSPNNYVTWEYSKTGGFFWGHYFNERSRAVTDMYDRAECEINFKRGTKSARVNSETFKLAKQCLIDNGIEEDEANIVLQALCYILLDEETEQYFH